MRKWIAAIAAILLLSGCGKEQEAVTDPQENNQDEVEKEVIEELPYNYPLTGIGSKESPEGRAFAVMINNHPQARPQSGLHKADVVYELLAEGNVTRFLAIFQSEQPESIGPVRSARDYYIELAKGYNALYVAHGYSPEAKKMLDRGYIDNINGMQYDGTLFKRSSSRVAPHNSYITSENILKGAEQRGYEMSKSPSPLSFLSSEELENLPGEEAGTVSISYFSSDLFNVIYEYDNDVNKYKRYSNGELTTDYESGDPVMLDNIFIVETDHQIIDSEGRRDIDLTSGGDAYLLQRGKWRQVEWKNIDGRILPYANGKVVDFVPGSTWINVIPSGPGLEESVSFDSVEEA